MNKKKNTIFCVLVIVFINIFIIIFGSELNTSNVVFKFKLNSQENIEFQVFYSEDTEMLAEQSQTKQYSSNNDFFELEYEIVPKTNFIRLDFGTVPSKITMKDFIIEYKNNTTSIDVLDIYRQQVYTNMIESINIKDKNLEVITNGADPYILLDITNLDLNKWTTKINNLDIAKEKIFICFTIDIIFLGLYFSATKFIMLPRELYRNKRLIYKMAKNDFKTKYAGSYFGIFWAFIQPLVTILLYWFVFQVGLRTNNVNNYPFVLWLIAGLVPWFFFSDSLNSSTNALIEYNYLVKKVVFNISILPIVKIISALFVHIFFIIIMLSIFVLFQYYPSIYAIQIFYYTFCVLMLALSISYCTSSIILFFRDLGQIINIILQILMWMTPIMWSKDMISDSFSWIFKFNPMYYIIRGYRDALLDKVWFMEHLSETFIFWLTVGSLFILGMVIFKKLRPHFADVL